MASNDVVRGNVNRKLMAQITLSPTSVAPNTTAEQTFTVTGLSLNNWVGVNKPTTQAGLGIVGCRVSAKDTLAITFINATAATITPTASEVYTVTSEHTYAQPIPSVI